MKATKRILSGLLVLAMVLALCPLMTFAEETTDAVVSIAAFTNGTVTADKESYKIGETVTLTIAPEAGYSQKLYINGEPLLLGWKTNVYSFVATEENYAITGGFVPTFVSSTQEKWDTANNAQGVLNTYYTSGDSTWLGIDSAAESITVKVKNYQLGDGTGVDGFYVLLGFKIKGTNYTFRVIKQDGKYYCQRAGFKNAEGKADWTKKELDAATVEAILGDGADFKLERISDNKLAAYVNGVKYDTYEITGATAADAVTKIQIGHGGNLNEKIAIPYTVADPIFRVTGGSWNLDNQYDGSVTILNKTKDGSTIITNASDYKGVSVTVKDYLPTYDANGAITPNNFAMQFAFIFDNGMQYQVRLHNTDSKSPNYKLQNIGGTNCITGSGWKWLADLNAAQKQNLLEGDGVKITVMLEGPNAVLYADGQKKATVPLGEEYAGKLVQIQLCMNGNKTGGNIEIPFELIKASEEHIHAPAETVVENKVDATCGADGSYEEVVKCECGHEISRTPKVIPATGAHIYDEGVVTKEATPFETGVKTYTCGCGATKEEVIEKATFTMTTNKPTYQIGLIEPWFMQINARVIQPGTSNTTIDYSKVLNYGAFAIREPQMSNPDDLSIENLMNEENVVHFTKEAGNISITSDTYLTFKFTEGLYTYRLNQDIVWVVYYQTADGWFATATREKNLYDLMDSRKDSTDPIYGEFEKDVYAKMVTLFEQITDYRSDFDEQKDGIPQNTATLGNTNIVFGADNSADGTVKFKRLQQIVLVEPWGIKLNTRIHWSTQTASSDHIDYNAAEDFGLIVYHDKTGAATGMATYEDMLNFADKDNIHVFSKSQGNMEASGAYMGATMNKDIFTYEMDSTLYYMFFLKVDGKFYYNKVNATNIKDLAAERALITDGTYSEKERAVYTAMVDLCDSITAYREDYFAKNPDLA